MIKTGPAYIECDGCQRPLWPGEGKTVLVEVSHVHVCSKACTVVVVSKHLGELPATPEEAEARQVEDAAKKAEHESIKKDHAARQEFILATQQARAAAIQDAIEVKARRDG